jgi:hypothetical protein
MSNQALFHDIHYAESARMHWQVNVQPHHSLEDILDPGYLWARHDAMSPGHRIDLFDAVGRFYVELLVVAIDNETKSIKYRVLSQHDWSGKPLPQSDISEARVEWGGPAVKWRVMHDGDVLVDRLATKEEAQEWLDERATRPAVTQPELADA